MPQLDPAMTFMIPMQGPEDFSIGQINAIFRFSERYGGLCEILILTDESEDVRIKLAWLAMELNRSSHPSVRTRMIRYTVQQDLKSLVEIGLNHAVGQKIVVICAKAGRTEKAKRTNMENRQISFVRSFLDASLLHKSETQTSTFGLGTSTTKSSKAKIAGALGHFLLRKQAS